VRTAYAGPFVDPAGDVLLLASEDPRLRFGAEDRLRQAGYDGRVALERMLAVDETPDALRDRATDLLGTLRRETALAAFQALVPEGREPDLWTAAVAVAAEAPGRFDLVDTNRRLEEIVSGARSAVPPAGVPRERAEALTRHLRHDLGFRGNVEAYDDVRNSWLPAVLERRLGIPITLSVLWVVVARRLGLEASGVGLPMHFVARCETDGEPVYVDAFHGTTLDAAGCAALVERAAGRRISLPASVFRPLRPREVVARMLRNLRAHHANAGDLHAALGAEDRLLHLKPLEASEWQERAILLARLDRPAAAARSLSRALALDPAGAARPVVEAQRREFQRAAALRN
jgi:regulator of sirC expression with transglutaminase-like and TPR domain